MNPVRLENTSLEFSGNLAVKSWNKMLFFLDHLLQFAGCCSVQKGRTSPEVQEGNERCKMQSRVCAPSPYIGTWIHPHHRRVSPWLPKACAFGMDACQDGNLLSFGAVNTPLPWRVYHQHQPLMSLSPNTALQVRNTFCLAGVDRAVL